MTTTEQKAPFLNLYQVKHVADTACKACVLCYKPTNTVLITTDKKDWFYVCNIHLKDKTYAKLLYCNDMGKDTEAEWKGKCNDIAKLKQELHKIEKEEKEKLDKEKSWLNNIPSWSSNKKDQAVEEKEKNEEVKEEKTKETLQSELKHNENELKTFERANIKYRLEKVFYRGRLMQDYKKKKQVEIEKKLAEGTLFPTLDGLSTLKK
ncbi:hypothetical protein C6P42_002507 [Pichia californica]|nr:hypothetical protein C6P42_002507 [[Candida] californica]